MISTSALLALVLQCAPSSLSASQNHRYTFPSTSLPGANGVVGRVLPFDRHRSGDCVGMINEQTEADSAQVQLQSSSLYIAEVDLNTILPSTSGSSSGSLQGAGQPVAPPVQPTYESWDVLRQYPRTAPLSQPPTAAPKPQENPKPTKDIKDGQSKTATE